MKIEFYSDGACSNNPGEGGWAYCCHYNDKLKVFYGYDEYTTNNRMEMMAAIGALEEAEKMNAEEVVIFTDSAYIANCFKNNWLENWKANGWINSKKQQVKNKELWIKMDNLMTKFKKVSFEKVKGHSGNKYNNIVDSYAVKARVEKISGSEIIE